MGRRAVALAALALLAPAAAHARSAIVPVNLSKLGPRIPSHFLGFSGEFDLMREALAQPNTGEANPVYVQLARNLAAYGGGMPVVRIGGGSTDSFWFANGVNRRQPGDLYTIDYRWLTDVRAYIEASGSPLILGVNLGRNDPALAAQWSNAVMNFFPRDSIKALEIGNEPDNFFQRIFVPPTEEMTRGPNYGPAQYLRELYAYTSAMLAKSPRPPLAGPSTIGSYPDWLDAIPKIIENQRHRLSLITVHRYPLFACGKKPGTKRKVSPLELMAPGATGPHAFAISELVKEAARFHKRVRLTESNSVACGGAHGVSDAFASGIWGVDWLFLMAAVGADGVDLHTSSLRYQPFNTFRAHDGRRAATVKPLYYAMLLFAQATAHRGRMIRSTFAPRTDVRLRTWGVYDPVDKVVRVAVVNKTGKPQRVRLRIRRGGGHGTVERLTAPKLSSTTVALGGRKFADPTFDGQLPGAPHVTRVSRGTGHVYSVAMPRFGVALLTVPVVR